MPLFGLAILLTLTLATCGERRFANSDEDEPAEAPELVVPFPNQVGTYWVYEVVDSVHKMTDTITISIVDTVTMPGVEGVASVWTCQPTPHYVGAPPSIYYVIADPETGTGSQIDTVRTYFWSEVVQPWLISIFPLPLDPGDNWISDLRYMYDSTYVEELIDVSVPAGEFSDVFRLTQVYSCGDECGATYTYWWQVGHGMIKSHLQEWDHYDFPSEPNVVATWVLIDYNIQNSLD